MDYGKKLDENPKEERSLILKEMLCLQKKQWSPMYQSRIKSGNRKQAVVPLLPLIKIGFVADHSTS